MRFICDKEIIIKEISIAQEIISSKNVFLILSNIYLEANNDRLVIRATDMKVNFETSIPVNVVEPGSTTVFGDKFMGILNSFPYEELEFILKDMNVIVKPTQQKKPEYKLKCITSDKFPEFHVSNKDFFDINIKDFKDMVKMTVFAVSDDETRYYMNGVYLEKFENKLNMVATDGRRLAFYSKEVENIEDFSGIIIPPKILNIIIKRSGDEGTISISINDKTIFLNFASYKFSSVLIEGQFPNYQKVIPENQQFLLSVRREELLNALHRVSLMVEKKSHRVYLGVSSGKMSVYSEESEIGTVDDEIPCQYDGEEIVIALNYRYIEEPFKIIKDDDIDIRFTTNIKAITIEAPSNKEFFHIVMPMQS